MHLQGFYVGAEPPRLGNIRCVAKTGSLPHGRDTRAYIVSAENGGDLLAYWEEIPANA